jgi:phage anti-repressor protein
MQKEFNLELNENGFVSSREIHKFLGVKKQYSTWIKTWIKNTRYKENKDFYSYREESRGGRPSEDFFVNESMATTLVMMSNAQFADEFRDYLISLFNKRKDLELITPEEAVFANKVLECLSYIENQKKAYELHQNSYIQRTIPFGNIYAQFNSYRNSITGWNKEKIENAVKEFILKDQHPIKSKSVTDRLNIIDAPEAIRVACLDLLLSENDNIDNANKFANLIKRMAKAKNVEPMKKNETDLFHQKNNEAKLNLLSNEIKGIS